MKNNLSIKIIALLVFILPFAVLLSACGKCNKQTFTDIVFEDMTVDYDGHEHEIVIGGKLPEGADVAYENNKATNSGEYTAKATITAKGYETLTLTAKLKINKINYDMSNARWDYEDEFTYNGTEHKVEIIGLPQGVTAQYTNNKNTNAGSYTATARLVYDEQNYNAISMPSLNWTIKKADYDMSNVKWTYTDPFACDGQEKVVLVEGLPEGVTVSGYQNNRKTEAGTYTATAILNYDKQNYNEPSIDECVWRILPDVSEIASNVLSSLMQMPDPWGFLPESFALENKAYSGNTAIDFTDFIDVASLPKVAMGKQMNVVYSTLIYSDNALSYLRYVYGSLNAIANLYQDYINSNRDNYASYEKQTENFTFKIVLDDSDYNMYISYQSVAIELSYIPATKMCYGRIQLSDSNVVKYEMSEDELTIAVNIVGLSLTKLHFEREEDIISGYLYEYFGTEKTNIKTSALIKVDENYTSIISNKRETDDLNIEGYMEVYDNITGNLIGAEVRETISKIKYETSWFNIWDVSNINKIKVLDEQNTLNADTIYINGSADPIKTKLVGGLDKKMASRRFDIEMKVMYLYTYDKVENKYEKVEISLPMLFVQNEFISTFAADFYEKNSDSGAVGPTDIVLNDNDKSYMFGEYTALIDEYLAVKEQVTYQSIIEYLGNRNEYFN